MMNVGVLSPVTFLYTLMSLARCVPAQSRSSAFVFMPFNGFVFLCSCPGYGRKVEALCKQYVQKNVGLGCAHQNSCRLWSSCHCWWCYGTNCSWQRDGVLCVFFSGNCEGLNCITYDGGSRRHVEGWQLVLILAVSKHGWYVCIICIWTLHTWNVYCWCICILKKKGNVPKDDINLQEIQRMNKSSDNFSDALVR
jgi:hypothetical protein